MTRRIFISSKTIGLEPFREAAELAVQSLDLEALLAESRPASAGAPQAVCLDLVRQADVTLLLLGREYGYHQASGRSATEEEFEEAVRLRKPVLVFVVSKEFEPSQAEFVGRARGWEGGFFGPECLTPVRLQAEVVRALRGMQGTADDPEIKRQVTAALQAVLPENRGSSISKSRPWLAMAWSPRSPVERIEGGLFFGEFCAELADWFVSGPSRMLETRPRVAPYENHLVLTVPREERHPGFKAIAFPEGRLAIACEFQRSRNGDLGSMTGMFNASPSVAVEMLRTMLALADRFMRRMDPQSLGPQGFIQVGLTNLGMAHFSEPIKNATGGVPIRFLEPDGPFIVPAEPLLIGRADLVAHSPQAQALIARLSRRIHPGGLEHQVS